ncbi:MAG: peptidoglycan DD-metalloendopeptidase family protein [Campylobacterota bacterium]
MLFKLLLSSVLLFSILSSTEYPKTFSKLGTPLYKSLKPISQYSDIELLKEKILNYEKEVRKSIAHGFDVDKSKDKKEIKKYLFELRKLQKSYDYLLHLLHDNINKAIDNKDYKLFLKLTSYEFDGLLKNSNLRNRSIEFYKKNSKKKRIRFLDKKIKREKLIEETSKIFYNEVVNSTYDPYSKTDSTKTVVIDTEKMGKYIYVTLRNKNIYDVTVSVKARYKNITESANTPKVIVLKAKSTKNYTKLQLGSGPSSYGYSYSWIIGDIDAVHDDSYNYRLPYAKGASYAVSQAYNTIHTHKGQSKYAIDFAMDEGTKIYAARGGVVVKTKSDSNIGGYSDEFAKHANYVMIAHSDGTFANYGHLKRNGVTVRVGDVVQRGYALGYSGNTGYSSGPHLHFSVFSAVSAEKTDTIAIRFDSQRGVVQEPVEGVFYTAK